MRSTATVRRLAVLAAAALTVAVGPLAASAHAAAAHPASSSQAARSTQIWIDNWTQCEMDLDTDDVTSGIFTPFLEPEKVIVNSTWSDFQSESDGILTGTAGTVSYHLTKCANPANNNKTVWIHWNNPYYGANSYSTAYSSSGVHFTQSGGSGNNAVAYFKVTV